MDFIIQEGLTAISTKMVTSNDTAIKYDSGNVEVFATPGLISLIEKTCRNCVDLHLPVGYTTVGIQISASHIKATPVGMKVRCEAKLEKVDGKKLFFTARVWDEVGLISESSHERFIVNVDKFMDKARSDINEK